MHKVCRGLDVTLLVLPPHSLASSVAASAAQCRVRFARLVRSFAKIGGRADADAGLGGWGPPSRKVKRTGSSSPPFGERVKQGVQRNGREVAQSDLTSAPNTI